MNLILALIYTTFIYLTRISLIDRLKEVKIGFGNPEELDFWDHVMIWGISLSWIVSIPIFAWIFGILNLLHREN